MRIQVLVVARQLLSDNLRGAQQLLDALDNDEDAIATHAESDASSTRRSRARKSVGSDR